MPAIRWVAIEPRTGKIIEELPGTRATSTLPVTLGKDNTATVELPITDRLPERWELATQPGRGFLAAIYDDPQQTVLWCGYVSRRTRGSGPTISLQLTDMNGFLKNTRRTLNWTFGDYDTDGTPIGEGEEQTTIMRRLGGFVTAGMFHGDVVEIPSGVLRHRRYRDDEDKTRLDAMQQLMNVIDGCEWKFDYRWDDSETFSLIPTFAQSVGRRVGQGKQRPVLANVDWTLTEDYSPGKGATLVTGVATREGDERVMVKMQDDLLLDYGWLVLEHRWSPDTGSVDEEVIADYTAKKLADISHGSNTYSVQVTVADSPHVFGGEYLGLGDDITIDVTNPDLPGSDATIDGRLIGWVAEPDPESGEIVTVEPILYADDEED